MSSATEYRLTERERQNLSQVVDYSAVQSLPQVWAIAAQRFSSVTAVQDPHAKPEIKLTYAELYQQMQQFAAGLQALGVQAHTAEAIPPRIALFADNSPRWLIADQGIMQAGAANVVRGSQADVAELRFILEDSGAIALIVENRALLQKLRPHLDPLALRFVVLLSNEAVDDESKVLTFSQVLELGATNPLQPVPHTRETLATLMYTSGTSGMPRGVMLSHGNLISQILNCPAVLPPQPGERVLSILPIWHSYERSFEYFIFSQGCTQIYTNIRQVKKDLKEHQPNYMVGVPRLWESIYEGIQKQLREQSPGKQRLVRAFWGLSQQHLKAQRLMQGLDLDHLHPSIGQRLWASVRATVFWLPHQLGDRLVYRQIRVGCGNQVKIWVSGGGSIANHLEDFFEIVGLEILGGYGLTETSPITHVRRRWRNLRGADGQPIPGTETRIVDLETRQPLPPEQQGVVQIRGPQVMQGYYNNPAATQKAIDPEGWFDTGDLGWVTTANDLVITGPAKDTIVLTNGENIEPQPIENACLRSPYIDQIMLVGQDQKVLGALVVPNLEALQHWASQQNLNGNADQPFTLQHCLADHSEVVTKLLREELNREVQNRPGYRPDDRIGPFRLVDPFTIENGLLTQTLKIRRNVVMDRYQGMINEMFG